MSRLVEFGLQDGASVLVRVEDAGGPVTRGFGDQRVVEQARQTFEQAVDRVAPAAEALLARLRASMDAPSEVQVEFGVELSAEAGAIIATAASKANFRISLTWRAHQDPPPPTTG